MAAPAKTETLPAFPFTAEPARTNTNPVLPLAEEPDSNRTEPLAPEVPTKPLDKFKIPDEPERTVPLYTLT